MSPTPSGSEAVERCRQMEKGTQNSHKKQKWRVWDNLRCSHTWRMYRLFCSSGHDTSAVEHERSTTGALKEGLHERVGGSRVWGVTSRCRDHCVPAQPATESKLYDRGCHALPSLIPPLHALLFYCRYPCTRLYIRRTRRVRSVPPSSLSGAVRTEATDKKTIYRRPSLLARTPSAH